MLNLRNEPRDWCGKQVSQPKSYTSWPNADALKRIWHLHYISASPMSMLVSDNLLLRRKDWKGSLLLEKESPGQRKICLGCGSTVRREPWERNGPWTVKREEAVDGPCRLLFIIGAPKHCLPRIYSFWHLTEFYRPHFILLPSMFLLSCPIGNVSLLLLVLVGLGFFFFLPHSSFFLPSLTSPYTAKCIPLRFHCMPPIFLWNLCSE